MKAPLEASKKLPPSRLGESRICHLEVLTPIHVGSGNKLAWRLDFVTGSQQTKIVPQSAVMAYLEQHPNEISHFSKDSAAVLARIKDERIRNYSLKCTNRELLEFERSSKNGPYVPGSSIKGALRTVLLDKFYYNLPKPEKQALIRQFLERSRIMPQWADEDLVKALFGKDPTTNFLRTLITGDIPFQDDHLDLKSIYILNLKDKEGAYYGWRDLRSRRSLHDMREVTPIFAEMLKPGSRSSFRMKLDSFLFQHNLFTGTHKTPLSYPELATWCNAYAKRHINEERKFYEELDSKQLYPVLEALDRLEAAIPPKSDSPHAFLLRTSWGGGWNSMTGRFLPKSDFNKIRDKMPRDFGYPEMPFPKTRRIVFENQRPQTLTGWVKIQLKPPEKRKIIRARRSS